MIREKLVRNANMRAFTAMKTRSTNEPSRKSAGKWEGARSNCFHVCV